MGKGNPDKNKNAAKQQDKPGRGARNQKLDPAMFGLGGTSTLGGLGQLGAVARPSHPTRACAFSRSPPDATTSQSDRNVSGEKFFQTDFY